MAYDNSDGRLRGRKLQSTRLRIWAASEGHCARCGKLVAYPRGFELDHIKAVNAAQHGEDINADSNLQVLCVELDVQGNKTGCHVTKTAQDMGYDERPQFDKDGRILW